MLWLEVRRNLLPHQQIRFDEMLAKTEIFSDPETALPSRISLVEKDRAVLAAAIHAGVQYLITGDKRHFRHLYGTTVAEVRIVSPADFLDENAYRLPQ
jgi:predicted nucleic acid-binding protein